MPTTTDTPTRSILAEIESSKIFADESNDWHYAVEHATFAHQNACEFVFHVGGEQDNDGDSHSAWRLNHMREHGCSEEFVALYQTAIDAGAVRVLFWA